MHWILLLYCRRIANPLPIPNTHPDRRKRSKKYSQVKSVISSLLEINFSINFRHFIFLLIALTMCSHQVSSFAVQSNKLSEPLIQNQIREDLHFSHSSSNGILSRNSHRDNEVIINQPPDQAISENCILCRVIENRMAQRKTSLLRKKQRALSRLGNNSWIKDTLKGSSQRILNPHETNFEIPNILRTSRSQATPISKALIRQVNAYLSASHSRTRRMAGDRKLRKLYSKHGFLLEILPNGKVRGTYDAQSKYGKFCLILRVNHNSKIIPGYCHIGICIPPHDDN